MSIENFTFVSKSKRQNNRASGVAILHNQIDNRHSLTSLVTFAQHSQSRDIGDICFAECKLPNNQIILLVSIYISPSQTIDNIILFLYKSLMPYSIDGASLLTQISSNTNLSAIPIILGGDFNINFAKDTSRPLIQFLKDKFNLELSNNPQQSTTKHFTTIDTVFTRYIVGIETKLYATYFSYHKPLITVVPI